MELKIKLGVSENSATRRIELEDYNISDEDWAELSHDEKLSRLQEVSDVFDQPFWVIEKFEEI